MQLINVPFSATADSIKNAFGHCGNIVDVRFIIDQRTGKHKGICYIEFDNENEAEKAVASSGVELNQRKVVVSYAKEARSKTNNNNNYY